MAGQVASRAMLGCCGAVRPASPAVSSDRRPCHSLVALARCSSERTHADAPTLGPQVAALSWLEFCKLWKDYMAALREGLNEASAFSAAHPGAECPAAKRLARLVYETGVIFCFCWLRRTHCSSTVSRRA